jgi:DNA-binding Xre family transcriptional regulator
MKINKPKLHSEMARCGLKAQGLADAVGMSLRAIHYILTKDTISWRALEKLAAYFKLDPKDLLK